MSVRASRSIPRATLPFKLCDLPTLPPKRQSQRGPVRLRTLPLGSGRGTSTPALFIDVFRPTASMIRIFDAAGFPGSHPFRLSVVPACAFPPADSSGSRLPNPTFRCLSCFRSRRSAVCTASGLQALRGFHLLASISRDRVSLSSRPVWHGRRFQSPAWATCSVP